MVTFLWRISIEGVGGVEGVEGVERVGGVGGVGGIGELGGITWDGDQMQRSRRDLCIWNGSGGFSLILLLIICSILIILGLNKGRFSNILIYFKIGYILVDNINNADQVCRIYNTPAGFRNNLIKFFNKY